MMLMLELASKSSLKTIVPVVLEEGCERCVSRLPQVVCKSTVQAVSNVFGEMDKTASAKMDKRTVRDIVEEIFQYEM
eukprot:546604-Hanusia_phi.AAC.1